MDNLKAIATMAVEAQSTDWGDTRRMDDLLTDMEWTIREVSGILFPKTKGLR